MPPTDPMVKRFQQRGRKRKPPPYIYAPDVIPGYGQAAQTSAAKRTADKLAAVDHFPYPDGPFRPKRRSRTRPTPGARRRPRRD